MSIKNFSDTSGKFFFCKILFIGPSFEVQHSCVFTMVLRVETYFRVSRVQCVGGIGRGGGVWVQNWAVWCWWLGSYLMNPVAPS